MLHLTWRRRSFARTCTHRVQEGVLEAQLVNDLAAEHLRCEHRIRDADHLQIVACISIMNACQ